MAGFRRTGRMSCPRPTGISRGGWGTRTPIYSWVRPLLLRRRPWKEKSPTPVNTSDKPVNASGEKEGAMELKGKAHKFGDDINTDYIMSSRHRTQTLDYKQLAQHLMEDIRPGFYSNVQPGDFIVGGKNFGCGSSREYAPKIIKAGGISAILAKTFA